MMRAQQSKNRQAPLLSLIVLLVLAAVIFSGGCVKMIQKSTESTQAGNVTQQNSTGTGVAAAIPETTVVSVQQVPVAEMTPEKSAAVIEVTPYQTYDPYPVIHGTRINQTRMVNPIWTGGYEFRKTYTLRGNATGLLVNVVEGPLYIVYIVDPEYDCTKDPESCRGDKLKPVNRPYLTITARDNQTQEVVAEDGYSREYSSDIGNYEFSYTAINTDGLLSSAGTEVSTTSTPGPRVIKIFREGTYQITIEGNFLDVDVGIKTGASPTGADMPTGATQVPDEEEEW